MSSQDQCEKVGPTSSTSHGIGTQDILQYVPAITALWEAKGITPKQHYSEPRNPKAIIRRDLRPHSKRVYSLPPCAPTMDLMIEAKDKEQAVFELRRKWGIEGGIPSEWNLKGEKMDEEREVPSYEGVKVFYEEGEEWRFKPPIKMPVKVSKVLEKLAKERVKVEKQMEKVGDDKGELERIEMDLAKIEDDRKKVMTDWEREKRIKWGLEKKVDEEGNEITPTATPKKKSKAKKKTVVKDEEDEDDIPEGEVMGEDIQAILPPRSTPRGAGSGRSRVNYAEMEFEGNGDEEIQLPSMEITKKASTRGRRKTSLTKQETGNIPDIALQTNGDLLQTNGKLEEVGKKRNGPNNVKNSGGNSEQAANEIAIRGPKRTTRAMKSQT
jgi:UV-endonuclease UvdE